MSKTKTVYVSMYNCSVFTFMHLIAFQNMNSKRKAETWKKNRRQLVGFWYLRQKLKEEEGKLCFYAPILTRHLLLRSFRGVCNCWDTWESWRTRS